MTIPEHPLVTLLTDFGTSDVFVGLCHAAVLAESPYARIVDLSHTVAPQDVVHGAARLRDAVPWVPAPAVHVAVVDPGVGSDRRGIVLECPGGYLVGPDNGLLISAAERLGAVTAAWELTAPETASATFHGRDLFAPVAGRLAAGARPGDLGGAIDFAELVRLASPSPSIGDGYADTEVRDIDWYGNLQLAMDSDALSAAGCKPGQALTVHARGYSWRAHRVRTFADLSPPALGVIEDSFGWVAVVESGGSAARELDIGLHAPVTVEVGLPGSGQEA